MKIQYDFLFLRDLALCMKTKHFFFMSGRKRGILISDLYLYSIKIQTDIDQNAVKKYTEKSQIFQKYFFEIFFLGRAGPA